MAGAFFTWLYYLPIYFQSIQNVSAQNSGIRNLPLIVATGIASIVSGGSITKTGHYYPVLIGGTVLMSIGAGLIYTFDIGTSEGKWIGYQILAGSGVGLTLQLPVIVSQNVFAKEVARVTAIVLFFQTIAGALFVSAAQSLFTTDIIAYIARNLKSVNPEHVVGTGATDLRTTFDAQQLPVVLRAYMAGLRKAFLISVPLAAIAAVIAIFALFVDYRVLDLSETHAGAETGESKTGKDINDGKEAESKSVRSREGSDV